MNIFPLCDIKGALYRIAKLSDISGPRIFLKHFFYFFINTENVLFHTTVELAYEIFHQKLDIAASLLQRWHIHPNNT